jgi:transcriptional regulator with XRE-family HTH domain
VPGNLRQRFGERIKELRTATGESQEAFADRVGLARSYVSRVERGKGNPSLDAIEAFAVALQVPVEALFVVKPGRRYRALFNGRRLPEQACSPARNSFGHSRTSTNVLNGAVSRVSDVQ